MEALLRAAMPKALDPNDPEQLLAWEACRRLLEQQARFYGLLEGRRVEDDDFLVPDSASVLSLDDYRRRFRDDRDFRPL
jgi:hypothetical protein